MSEPALCAKFHFRMTSENLAMESLITTLIFLLLLFVAFQPLIGYAMNKGAKVIEEDHLLEIEDKRRRMREHIRGMRRRAASAIERTGWMSCHEE